LPLPAASTIFARMPVPLSSTDLPSRSQPDFRHVEAWIFDLDNTLYPASSDLFAQIDAKMTVFVQDLLGLNAEDARRLQKTYYRDHGTTLNGLMRLHGVRADDYLARVHDIDLSVLTPDPLLKSALSKLPGRRFVFTNGCRHHAARVLNRLDLDGLFLEVWDIRSIDYRPKPDLLGYRAMLEANTVDPTRAVMFEDAARNLVPAHELGMTTVWLRNGSVWSKQGPEHPVPASEHIHYEIDDLSSFLHAIKV
jgi:putative hydrolase of the HAD superfamily